MSDLDLPTSNPLKQNIMPVCTGNAQSNWNKTTLDGGYVLWCGDLDLSASAVDGDRDRHRPQPGQRVGHHPEDHVLRRRDADRHADR